MKTVGLSYEEAKNLLLHGYKVKLPKWKGYWVMNSEGNGIEAHTKDGKVLKATDTMCTLSNNWEIATDNNCPVLKKELEKNNQMKNQFKVIDITIPADAPSIFSIGLVILQKGVNEIIVLDKTEFEEMFGYIKSREMISEFMLSELENLNKSI